MSGGCYEIILQCYMQLLNFKESSRNIKVNFHKVIGAPLNSKLSLISKSALLKEHSGAQLEHIKGRHSPETKSPRR